MIFLKQIISVYNKCIVIRKLFIDLIHLEYYALATNAN